MTEAYVACRMVVRSKEGLEVFNVPGKKDEPTERLPDRHFVLQGPTTFQTYRPDGSAVYAHQPSVGVIKCSLDGSDPVVVSPFLNDSKAIQMLATSTKGTYLLTWERQQGDQPNMKVWEAATGKFLHAFVQKNLKREGWPYVKWSFDESLAFLMTTNEIRVYDGHVFAKEEEVRFLDKMRCPGIASMSVPKQSEASRYLVTSFCPGDKNKPATANLHQYPSVLTSKLHSYPAICSKSLFQAEEAIVHWSPKGDSVLMAMQTSIDTSGESYYGSTTLYLFSESSNEPVAVPLPNKSSGPVLDVSWMPNPNKPPCFAVISGRMPAMASLHHGTTGEAIFLFGNAHRNTICWADHGRFVCLAGFGNLAGGMTFWDRNKLKAIPQYDEVTGVPIFPELKASCTVGYGWSPDSKLFGTSTTSPRLNVDNGVRLFRYNGEELTNVPWDNANYKPDRLLQVSFIPALPDVYPDRGQSPAPKIVGDAATIAEVKKAANEAAIKVAEPTVQRYVPPSARGRIGGTNLSDRIRAEMEGKIVGATRVQPRKGIPGASSTMKTNVPVGMVPVQNDEKSKNALQREKKKLVKARKAEEEAKLIADQEAAKIAAKEAAAADPMKISRKLTKNLKQIDELKERDPNSLNDDQKQKIASEASLRAELANLGL